MKFLIDTSKANLERLNCDLVAGQLLTPLTNYKNCGETFAMDNGAFAGFDRQSFFRMLKRNEEHKERCLFVTVPDIVGSATRTRELYFHFTQLDGMKPWAKKWCFVMQDGMENERIDWYAMRHIFIGGSNDFKDSHAAYDIVKTAKALGVPVHVGRVNTYKRYRAFADLGADTCDGSGIAKYDHMLLEIKKRQAASQPQQTQSNLFGEPCKANAQ